MFTGSRDGLIATTTIIATIILTLVLYFLIRLIRRRFRPNRAAVTQQPLSTTTQPQPQPQPDPKRKSYKNNYPLFFHRSSTKTELFNWADHPTLITDVIENGWSRFAFTNYNSTPSTTVRSSLFNSLRVVTDEYHDGVEESWEVGLGSADLMQKLHFRINDDGQNISTSSAAAKLTARMNLPLPGPEVGDSFPQEAYFEITVVGGGPVNKGGLVVKGGDDGNLEKAKLLSQHSDSSIISGVKHSASTPRTGSRKEGNRTMMLAGFSVGNGGPRVNKVAGSYPGSIAFHSNGALYLSGMKLAFESENQEWAQHERVIGCGFNPNQKKVFFTLDSEVVHVIHCKSEYFEKPMYPVIASNIDVTVIVNLGQSSFSYAPANAHRTSNPCFTGRFERSTSPQSILECDDSRELFSMERLDSEWRAHCATLGSTSSTTNNNHRNNCNNNDDDDSRIIGYDDESEAELFEIVIDNS